MLGPRYTFLDPRSRARLEEGALDWLWAECERSGVPVAMLATDSLGVIGDIAQRHPELRITLDHVGGRGGNTTLKDAASMTHMPQLLAAVRDAVHRSPHLAFLERQALGHGAGRV